MPIKAIKEVSDLLGNGDGLSLSLRMTKFAKVEETGKSPIEFLCGAKTHTSARVSSFSVFRSVPSSVSIIMRINSRLIVNHAGGVLENAGLCIHRHFNYPYIPGSAVKGIARHAAWNEWYETRRDDAELAKKIAITFGYPTGDKCPKKEEMSRPTKENYLDEYLKIKFPDLFGKDAKHENYSGSVSFLPAIPHDSNWKLVPDIVNCHHMNYYGGKEPNAKALDTESPNPQFFPAVEAGAIFVFTLLPVPGRDAIPGFNPLGFAKEYLKKGLEEHGIGAKTSSGYGWFEEDVEDTNKLKAEAESARNELEKQKREKEEKLKNPVGFAKKEILVLDEQKFAEFAKIISQKSESEQRAFFEVLVNEKKEVLKRWRKKKPQNIDAIKPIADKLKLIITI